jgi:hypothetical protein
MQHLAIDEGHALIKYEVFRGPDNPTPESVFTKLEWLLTRYDREPVDHNVTVSVWHRDSLFSGRELRKAEYCLAEFVHVMRYFEEKALRPELV